MKNKLETAFDNYLKNYDMNRKEIRYKYHHSYRVRDLMNLLSDNLKLSNKEKEVAEVIGLLHDIGRFEQIKKYGNCSDVKSGIDHADESCVFLFDEGHIKDFYDDEEYFDIIRNAIKNHNKFKIDNKLDEKSLLFTKMIRDMDKVDIFRVIAEEYTVIYDKNELSKEVLEEFNNKKTIDSHLRQSRTDDVYCYFAFIYDINFNYSFKLLKEGKYIDNLCSVITPKEDSIEDFNNLKNEVFNYIDEKIETI